MLQFTNGKMFIGDAVVENMLSLKGIHWCFELISGLKVNFFKSKLADVAVETGFLRRLDALLQYCRTMSLLFIYLGIPAGGNP